MTDEELERFIAQWNEGEIDQSDLDYVIAHIRELRRFVRKVKENSLPVEDNPVYIEARRLLGGKDE